MGETLKIQDAQTFTPQSESSLTISTGSSGLAYVSKIKMRGVTWRGLEPDQLVTATIAATANGTETVLGASSFAYDVEESADLVRITMVSLAPNAGLTLRIDFTPTDDGWDVSPPKIAANSTGKGVRYLDGVYMRLAPYGKPSEFCASWQMAGGHVIPDVCNSTILSAWGAPSGPQFGSFYDAGTQAHFYFWTDDETLASKFYFCQGLGDSVLFFMRHHPTGGIHTVNNTWTPAYTLHLESFRGRSLDGHMGFVDAALRFRTWARDPERPWMTRSSWGLGVGWPAKVSGATFLAIHHDRAYDTYISTEVKKIMAYVGATSALEWFYDWGGWNDELYSDIATDAAPPDHNLAGRISNVSNSSGLIKITTTAAHGLSTGNQVDISGVGGVTAANVLGTATVIDATNFTLQGSTFSGTYTAGTGAWIKVPAVRTAVRTAWTDMAANGIGSTIYTQLAGWTRALLGRYGYNSFPDQPGIVPSARVLKKADGTDNADPLYAGLSFANLDFAEADLPTLLASVMFRIGVEMGLGTTAGLVAPAGLYFDAWANFFGRLQFNPAKSSWTTEAYNAGLVTCFKQIRDVFRVVSPGAHTFTEWCSVELLGEADLMFLTSYPASTVPMMNTFAYVHGQDVRLTSFENDVQANSPVVAAAVSVHMARNWLQSGLPSYNVGASVAPSGLVAGASVQITDGLYFVFDYMKTLQTAWTYTARYMKGRRMLPFMVDDPEGLLIRADTNYLDWWRSNGLAFQVQHACYQDLTYGDVAGIFTHFYPNLDTPPGNEFAQDRTVRVQFDAKRYPDLDAGMKTAYLTVGGVRTQVGRFSSCFEYSFTIAPNSVVMIEIVPDVQRLVLSV